MESLKEILSKEELDLLKYSTNPILFIQDILGLECKPFHQEWIELFELLLIKIKQMR